MQNGNGRMSMQVDTKKQREQELRSSAALCSRTHELPSGSSQLDLEWRFGLKRALDSGDIQYYDTCNLTEVLQPGTIQIFKGSAKEGASNSVIAAGILNYPQSNAVLNKYKEYWDRHKCDVILKITFPRLYPAPLAANLTDGLTSEILIYQFLNELVDRRVTPNLVISLGTFDCTFKQLSASTDPEVMRKLTAETQAVYSQKRMFLTPDDTARFLLLERGRGTSLANMLESKKLQEKHIVSLIFQVLYTLNVLSDRGIRHADLHQGNIFIDRLSNPETVVHYFPNPAASSVYASVPTYGLVAKLYDWDWGGIYEIPESQSEWPRPPQLIRNQIGVSNCDLVSSCGQSSKADAYTFLSGLYDMPLVKKMKNVIEFLERVVHPTLLQFGLDKNKDNFEKRGGFGYRLCKGPVSDTCPPTITNSRCTGPWLNVPDCIMQTPYEMLGDALFAPYFKNIETDGLPEKYVYGNWTDKSQYEYLVKQLSE